MSYLYRKLKDEILKDHERNHYKSAVLMPLSDKYNVPKSRQAEYKQIAKRLSEDKDFPYLVECTIYSDSVKMGYKPLE